MSRLPWAKSVSSAALSVTVWAVNQLLEVNVSDLLDVTVMLASVLSPAVASAMVTVTSADGWVASFTV